VRDVAWLAGFLEGEGYFGQNILAGRSKHVYQPRFEVTSTDRDVVARVAALVNEKVYPRKRQAPHHKPQFRVIVSNGTKAAAWLMTLWAYMGNRRRRRFTSLLRVWRSKPDRNGEKWKS
jgi:hypothetical protein